VSNGRRLQVIGALGLLAGVIQALGHADVAGGLLVVLNLVALSAKPGGVL